MCWSHLGIGFTLPTLHPSNLLTFPMMTLRISPFSLTLEEEDSVILHLRLVLSFFFFILISCHLVSSIKILYDDYFLESYDSCPVTCSEPSFVSVELWFCIFVWLYCYLFFFPGCLIKLRWFYLKRQVFFEEERRKKIKEKMKEEIMRYRRKRNNQGRILGWEREKNSFMNSYQLSFILWYFLVFQR